MTANVTSASVPKQVQQYFLQFGFRPEAISQLYSQPDVSWPENAFTPTTTIVTC